MIWVFAGGGPAVSPQQMALISRLGDEVIVVDGDPGGVDGGVFGAGRGGQPETCVSGEGEAGQVQAALLAEFPYGGPEGVSPESIPPPGSSHCCRSDRRPTAGASRTRP